MAIGRLAMPTFPPDRRERDSERTSSAQTRPTFVRSRSAVSSPPSFARATTNRCAPAAPKATTNCRRSRCSTCRPLEHSQIDEARSSAVPACLEQKLADFGVEGRVVEVQPGPVVTMYKFEPGSGIKVSQIVNLADDLSMALAGGDRANPGAGAGRSGGRYRGAQSQAREGLSARDPGGGGICRGAQPAHDRAGQGYQRGVRWRPTWR